MSAGHQDAAGLQPAREVRSILDVWAQSLAEVLQSMTGERPAVEWQMASGPVLENESAEALLWWEQPLEPATPASGARRPAEMTVWIVAPRASWQFAGALTLKAAGLADATDNDARNTWCEILGQSLGAMARGIGAAVGYEVTCGAAVERAPETAPAEWVSAGMRFAEPAPRPLALLLSPQLVGALGGAGAEEEKPEPEPVEEALPPSQFPGMDLLLDVDLPVSISFGRTQLALSDVLKLTTGSIVELNCGVNDQVEVLVNHCLVARGEVVVVDGNYGVRVLEIASRRDRLRGLR